MKSPINPLLPLSRRQCLMALAALPALAGSATRAQTDNAVLELWQRIRAQWLLSPRQAYFDTATLAPMLRAVLAAQYRTLEALHTDPRGYYASRYAASAVHDLLDKLENWLGCEADELAGVQSAEAGLMQAADMLPLAAGEAIVVSSQLPELLLQYWQQRAQRQGCELRIVHLPMPVASREQVLDAFTAAMGERARVLCVSHVQFIDGTLLPVRELCALSRERGITTLVEGSLALGAVTVSLHELGCEIYAGSLCHWMQGAAPSAVLYVQNQLQDKWPERASAMTLPSGVSLNQWPRLQHRWPEDFIVLAPQFQALPTALQWQAALGRSVLENRLRQLQTYVRINVQGLAGVQVLTSNQPGMQLQVLSLRAESRSAVQLADWLARNDNVVTGVTSNSQEAMPVLRIALHAGNSLDDIDRLVQGLTRALRQG